MATGWTFSLLLLLLAVLHSLDAVPALTDTRLEDEATESTEEPLDFKDVPIFPKDKPPPGYAWVLKKRCKRNQTLSDAPVIKPVHVMTSAPIDNQDILQIVQNVKAALANKGEQKEALAPGAVRVTQVNLDSLPPALLAQIPAAPAVPQAQPAAALPGPGDLLIKITQKNPNNIVPVNNDDGVKDYTGYRVYRVTIPTELAAKWILKFEDMPGIEFWADPKLILRPKGMFMASAADILVAPDIIDIFEDALKEAFLPFDILIPDLQAAIRKENPPDTADPDLVPREGHRLTWNRYHNYNDIDSYFEYLKRTFPNFVTVDEIGRSTEGRAIKVIKLHQSGGRADKKAILLDAGIHAREWITPATITYMIRELVEGGTKYDCLLNQFDFHFVPIINPDGYEYSHTHNRMWRKTRSNPDSAAFTKMGEENLHVDRMSRFEKDPVLSEKLLEKLRSKIVSNKASSSCQGVDANRNFDFQWLTGGSSKNPCVDVYAGPRAFSEPETKALSNYILTNRNQIEMYISLHAYSQMWLLPWGYTQEKPTDYSDLYAVAKVGAKALEKVHGTSYLIGTIPDLLYAASGSSIDWVKGVAGIKYAYTLELRDVGRHGFILPAEMIIPSGQETWAAVYASALELGSRIYSDATECPAI